MFVPITISDQLQLPEPLAQQRAGDLREPVVDAGEEAEDAAGEQRVVEVRDDEVGAVRLVVEHRRGDEDPAQPADQELDEEREREQHRGAQHDRAADQRADHVEVLDPGRHQQRGRGEREVLVGDPAGDEHVVRPHAIDSAAKAIIETTNAM